MRFEQVKEVLAYVEDLHDRIARSYATLGEHAVETRTRMLLDYMSARELSLAETVHSFIDESPAIALREYDPFSHDDGDLRRLLAETLAPEATPEQVLDLGMQVRDWFLAFFAKAAEKSRNSEQRTLFNSLRDRGEREKQKLARNANMLGDF